MKKSKKGLQTLSMLCAMLLVLPSLVCLVSADTGAETGTYITNVALGKTATASSNESTARVPSYGNDGSTSSLWVANDGNPGNWWMVDLGTVYSIHGSEIEFEYEGDIWQYLVEVSSDGTAWTTIVDKSANTSSTKIQTDLYTVAGRYVRVTITGVPSSRWTAFSEFRVWGEETISITGTNVALQKTVSAISQENVDRAASNIVDGNTDSLWIASNGNAGNWVQTDLGSRYDLNALRLTFENDQRVWQYRIQTSLNNVDWITVVDQTDNYFALQTHTFPIAITAQYIRIIFEAAPGTAWTALGEFEAFGTPGASAGEPEKILVIVPHEDDEAIIAAGIIHKAILDGDTVKVAVVTNGDCNGYDQSLGINRLDETITAMEMLGLSSSNITAFGYADTGGFEPWTRYTDSFLYRLYHTTSDTEVLSSNFGNSQTYGITGVLEDYHYATTGSHASYTRANFVSDLTTYIEGYMPDKIYTTSAYDLHGDHGYLNVFVSDILRDLLDTYPNYTPILYESIVHSKEGDVDWPIIDTDPTPIQAFTAPANLSGTPLRWEERISVSVPAAMLTLPRGTNLKNACLAAYTSQYSSYIGSFAKADEIFWAKDYSNLAYRASVSASSAATNGSAEYASDGMIGGYLELPDRDWLPDGETVGAWVQLTWPSGQDISKIVLHDATSGNGNIASGTLLFSDGTSIPVGELDTDGKSLVVSVDLDSITWVKFVISSVEGTNIGLSEIEVY